MRGLVPYAWRSLVARPARTMLTAFGIAIGVAVLVAALAVEAGLDASIERTVAAQVGRADLRLAAFAEAGLSGRTLAAVDAVPGVAVAAPAIERHTFLLASSGRTGDGVPVAILGIDAGRELRVRDLDVVRGWAPTKLAPDEVLVSERLAAAEGLEVGDDLTLLGAGAPVRTRIGGVLAGDGPAAGSLGRTIVTSLEIATELSTPDGGGLASADPTALRGLSRIDIVLAAGADPAAVEAELERTLTTEPYLLTSPSDVADGAARDDGRRARDDGAAGRDQPVRGGVRHPEHHRDDRGRAHPRARPPARGGRDAAPRSGGSWSPRACCSARWARRWGSRPGPCSRRWPLPGCGPRAA